MIQSLCNIPTIARFENENTSFYSGEFLIWPIASYLLSSWTVAQWINPANPIPRAKRTYHDATHCPRPWTLDQWMESISPMSKKTCTDQSTVQTFPT
jgi:hypothetical protein